MSYQPKSYSKFAAAATTVTLVATAVTPAFAASFTDVSKNYKEAVDYLIENKITNGISPTEFGTDLTIKRVDAAVMIAKALKLETAGAKDAGFVDVPARAAAYVNALKEAGIVNGKTATTFGSEQNVTRGELAIILSRAYSLKGNTENLTFKDVSSVYDEAVAALVDNGITTGKSATQFGTVDSLKRGEMAIFLYRLGNEPKPEPVVGQVNVSTTAGVTSVKTAVDNAEGQTATVSVYSNGTTTPVSKTAVVQGGTVAVNFENLPAGTHKAVVKVGEVSEEASFTIEAEAPAVASVKSLNAKQIAVTFNTEVDEELAADTALYTLNSTKASKAVLSEDDKTVVLTFDGGAEVKDGVLVVNPVATKADEDKATTKYSSIFTYEDTVKPVVTNTSYTNGSITLTFSEELSTVPSVVRVNGTPIAADKVKLNDGDKTKVDITSTLEAGASVSLYAAGAKDTAKKANEMDLFNGSVTAPTADTNKPHVTNVQITGQSTAKITLSEAITQNTVSVTLQQGAQQTSAQLVKDPADTTGKTYTITLSDDIFGEESTSESFTLYIQKEAMTDTSGLKNDLFSTTLTFVKDTQAPVVASSKVAENNQTLSFTFDEAVKVSGSPATINIRNAEGVKFPVKEVSLSEDKKTYTVDIMDADAAMAAGTYTVSFPANYFTDVYENKAAAITDTFTVGQESPSTDTKKPEASVGTTAKNTFKVTFNEEVTTSALALSNYRLDGQALPAETDIYFTDASKTAVMIVLPENAINVGNQLTGTPAVLSISGATDKAGNMMTAGNFIVTVKDNTPAVVTDVKRVGTAVVVTFSDNVTLSSDTDANTIFDIKVNGTAAEAQNATAVSGSANQVQFNLDTAPASSANLTVDVKNSQTALTDLNGVSVK